MSPLKIHACVVSWKGQHDNAARIAAAIDKEVDALTIVFSDPDPAVAPPARCQLIRTDNALYWGDKFSTCLQTMDTDAGTDVMLLIHADCRSEDWAGMVRRCRQKMGAYSKIGLWAPLVEGSGISLEITRALSSDDSLSLVSYVDGLVFAITRPVIQRLQKYDFSHNKFGWGIDWAICAFVVTNNTLIVVDSSVHVMHPPGRGYETSAAREQMVIFCQQMTPQERVYLAMASSHVKLKRLEQARANQKA